MYPEIDNPTDYHVALYIRLSKEDEGEGPSQSVQNQEALLLEYVRQQRLRLKDTYVDDGWSGTNFDRPGFRRMLAAIETGQVNMVITKDLSRLGRDYILTGHYLERYFPEHRVRYISLLDGIDTGVDSSANDITPFRAILNDLYARDISKKIKSVKRDKQRRGQFIGGKAVYGYKKHPTEKNKIVVDEAVAPVVRQIFALALSGMSCRSIAAQLNRDGVPTPATYANLTVARPGHCTGLWSGERISEMLQNETYIGNMVQGRRVKISYKSRKCLKQDPAHWVVVEGTHEPLVDAETFAKVAMLLSSRRHTRCRTYDFCHTVQEKKVTQAVIRQVLWLCRSQLNREALLTVAREAVERTETAQNAAGEGRSLQSKIAGLTASLDRLYVDRLNGLLPEADFQRLFSHLLEQRRTLEAALAQHQRRDRSADRGEARAQELVALFFKTAGENRELLVNLIQRVELTAQREIHLHFRCAAPKGDDKERLPWYDGENMPPPAAKEDCPCSAPTLPPALPSSRRRSMP